jgi:hypothetical protein
MATPQIIQTIKWIEDQIPETVNRVFLQIDSTSKVASQTPDEEQREIFQALQELSSLQNTLADHPTAPQIMDAFGLKRLLDKGLFLDLNQALIPLWKDRRRNEIDAILKPLSENWLIMKSCVVPIERLTLLSSSYAENLFEQYKSNVDIKISAQLGREIGEKMNSISQRLSEGDSEALSQSLSSCRRVIDVFADKVYPPNDQSIEMDGNTVYMGPDKHKNRINAYIRERTDSKSIRDKLRQTLNNLYDRVSAGVHNDVTPEEAQSLFLQTYIFLGEVLTLGGSPTSYRS